METGKTAETLLRAQAADGDGGQPPAKEGATWFLSFDCATKTFAYCLLAFDPERFKREGARIKADMGAIVAQMKELAAELQKAQSTSRVAQPPKNKVGGGRAPAASNTVNPAMLDCTWWQKKCAGLADAVARATRSTDGMLRLADCATVDLAPGVPDREVHTIPRIRAVVNYLQGHIEPVLARWLGPDDTLIVLVEYQMGPNSPARIVEDAVITFYHERDVRLVGPALKNSIALCEEGRYCHFAEKYSKCYDANKAHTLYNFRHFLERTRLTISTPKKLWGHIADAFAQVLGYVATEPDPKSDGARNRALARF